MNNNKQVIFVFLFFVLRLRSDPSDDPSEEDDDEPQDEESFGFRRSEMIWSLITQLGSADTSSSFSQRTFKYSEICREINIIEKPSAEFQKHSPLNVSPPV